jgi:hypothetical protein
LNVNLLYIGTNINIEKNKELIAPKIESKMESKKKKGIKRGGKAKPIKV